MNEEEYWEKINFLINNNIFIRSGSCNQCGECCIVVDKILGTRTERCPHLEGKICSIHEQENKLPPICEMIPIYPHECMIPDAVDCCSYSWVLDNKLTKTEALEKYNRLCDTCYRKESCLFYDKVIEEINEKCI